MNKKTARIISIIALVFALIFTVTFIVALFSEKLLKGPVGSVALASGSMTVVLFLILNFSGAFKTKNNQDSIEGSDDKTKNLENSNSVLSDEDQKTNTENRSESDK